MGYDTACVPSKSLEWLYPAAYNEGRVVVTRNCRIAPSSLVRIIQLRSEDLEQQLQQLYREVPLAVDRQQVLTRCDRCNSPLEPIQKSDVRDRVPPYVYQTQQAFQACPSCQRVYWAATHWDRIGKALGRLTEEAEHA